MQKKQTGFQFLNKTTIFIVAILLIFLSATILVWQGNKNSTQAEPAMLGHVYFEGEYRIDDGEWQKIISGEHISSTKGDVITLRGKFHEFNPIGEYVGVYYIGCHSEESQEEKETPIALYINHINLTFYVLLPVVI